MRSPDNHAQNLGDRHPGAARYRPKCGARYSQRQIALEPAEDPAIPSGLAASRLAYSFDDVGEGDARSYVPD